MKTFYSDYSIKELAELGTPISTLFLTNFASTERRSFLYTYNGPDNVEVNGTPCSSLVFDGSLTPGGNPIVFTYSLPASPHYTVSGLPESGSLINYSVTIDFTLEPGYAFLSCPITATNARIVTFSDHVYRIVPDFSADVDAQIVDAERAVRLLYNSPTNPHYSIDDLPPSGTLITEAFSFTINLEPQYNLVSPPTATNCSLNRSDFTFTITPSWTGNIVLYLRPAVLGAKVIYNVPQDAHYHIEGLPDSGEAIYGTKLVSFVLDTGYTLPENPITATNADLFQLTSTSYSLTPLFTGEINLTLLPAVRGVIFTYTVPAASHLTLTDIPPQGSVVNAPFDFTITADNTYSIQTPAFDFTNAEVTRTGDDHIANIHVVPTFGGPITIEFFKAVQPVTFTYTVPSDAHYTLSGLPASGSLVIGYQTAEFTFEPNYYINTPPTATNASVTKVDDYHYRITPTFDADVVVSFPQAVLGAHLYYSVETNPHYSLSGLPSLGSLIFSDQVATLTIDPNYYITDEIEASHATITKVDDYHYAISPSYDGDVLVYFPAAKKGAHITYTIPEAPHYALAGLPPSGSIIATPVDAIFTLDPNYYLVTPPTATHATVTRINDSQYRITPLYNGDISLTLAPAVLGAHIRYSIPTNPHYTLSGLPTSGTVVTSTLALTFTFSPNYYLQSPPTATHATITQVDESHYTIVPDYDGDIDLTLSAAVLGTHLVYAMPLEPHYTIDGLPETGSLIFSNITFEFHVEDTYTLVNEPTATNATIAKLSTNRYQVRPTFNGDVTLTLRPAVHAARINYTIPSDLHYSISGVPSGTLLLAPTNFTLTLESGFHFVGIPATATNATVSISDNVLTVTPDFSADITLTFLPASADYVWSYTAPTSEVEHYTITGLPASGTILTAGQREVLLITSYAYTAPDNAIEAQNAEVVKVSATRYYITPNMTGDVLITFTPGVKVPTWEYTAPSLGTEHYTLTGLPAPGTIAEATASTAVLSVAEHFVLPESAINAVHATVTKVDASHYTITPDLVGDVELTFTPATGGVYLNYTIPSGAHFTPLGLPPSGSIISAPTTFSLNTDPNYYITTDPTATNATITKVSLNVYTITPYYSDDVTMTLYAAVPGAHINYSVPTESHYELSAVPSGTLLTAATNLTFTLAEHYHIDDSTVTATNAQLERSGNVVIVTPEFTGDIALTLLPAVEDFKIIWDAPERSEVHYSVSGLPTSGSYITEDPIEITIDIDEGYHMTDETIEVTNAGIKYTSATTAHILPDMTGDVLVTFNVASEQIRCYWSLPENAHYTVTGLPESGQPVEPGTYMFSYEIDPGYFLYNHGTATNASIEGVGNSYALYIEGTGDVNITLYPAIEASDACRINLTYSSGTGRASSVEVAEDPNIRALCLNDAVAVYYNGNLAARIGGCREWMIAERTFSEGDTVSLLIYPNELSTFAAYFNAMFKSNSLLTTFSMPELNVNVGVASSYHGFFMHTFVDCSALTSITLPSIIDTSYATNLGGFFSNTFYGTRSLTSLSLPDVVFSELLTEASTAQSFMVGAFTGSAIESLEMPLYDLSNGESSIYNNFFNGTFSETHHITDITAHTVNPECTRTWTNVGTNTNFITDITIHHDGDLLKTSLVPNVTSTGTITYDPPLPNWFYTEPDLWVDGYTISGIPSPGSGVVIQQYTLTVTGVATGYTLPENIFRVIENANVTKVDEYHYTITPISDTSSVTIKFEGAIGPYSVVARYKEGTGTPVYSSISEESTAIMSNLVGVAYNRTVVATTKEAALTWLTTERTFNDADEVEIFFSRSQIEARESADNLFANLFANVVHVSSVEMPAVSLTNAYSVNYLYSQTFMNCSSLSDITLPLIELNKDVSNGLFYDTFYGCTSLNYIVATTVSEDVVESWSSRYTEDTYTTNFVGDITIYHDGYWINSDRVQNITSSGRITFDPDLYGKNTITATYAADTNKYINSNVTTSTIKCLNDLTHVYKNGVLVATGSSDCVSYLKGNNPSEGDVIVMKFDCAERTDFSNYFTSSSSSNITSIFSQTSITSVNFSEFETSNGTTFRSFLGGYILRHGAFYGCTSLTSVTLPQIDTSNATDFSYFYGGIVMCGAFYGCTALTSVTFPEIDTSNGTEFSYFYSSTFINCSGLTTPPTLPQIDTSNGTNFSYFYGSTFLGCSGLTTPPTLPQIDTSNGTTFNNFYTATFSGCSGLTTPPTLPQIETSNGTTFSNFYYNTFANCSGLTSVTLPTINTSNGTNFSGFYSSTFANCSGLTTPPTLPQIETSNGTTFSNFYYSTFSGCTSLTEVHMPLFKTQQTSSNQDYFFGGNTESKVQTTFQGCTALTNVYAPTIDASYANSWTNVLTTTVYTATLFFTDVTIHHDGDWLASGRIDKLTSTGTITYDPPLA